MAILWIDDVRPVPDDFRMEGHKRLWAKSSKEAIDVINTYGNELRWISFDHDLGGDDTAMVVVDFLEELSYEGSFRPEVFEWRIHSANPVGRKRLQLGLTAVDRWLKNRGSDVHQLQRLRG